MIDIKLLKSGLEELAEIKKLPWDRVKAAMERAFAAAYQKEYGEKGQLIRCNIDFDNDKINFHQAKIVVDNNTSRKEDEELTEEDPRYALPRFNEEKHIMIEDAKLLKKNVELGEEITFELDDKDDFGRIALQTAKQVIMQSIKEVEREMLFGELEDKIHTIVSGSVERVERSFAFVNLGKVTAIMPNEEQIRTERLQPGQRVRAYLVSIEDTPNGPSAKLSRTHPNFLKELFMQESSEIADGIVEIVSIAREPGSRSKIAVKTHDEKVDPIGACVGQRGSRVNAITSELNGERIDIILHNEDTKEFIVSAMSPAKPIDITLDEESKKATVKVSPDEQSLAIGKSGQNVRLAAKLTGYRIDVISDQNESEDNSDEDNDSDMLEDDFQDDDYTETAN